MPYDPTIPVNGAALRAAELRNQFTGLKALIDAVTPPPAETDPVFAASEAALFGPGDKAKLDAALQNPAAFATAAQGARADTALQTETDPLALHLDQSTPQVVAGGKPYFATGLRGNLHDDSGTNGSLSVDAQARQLVQGAGMAADWATPGWLKVPTLGTDEVKSMQDGLPAINMNGRQLVTSGGQIVAGWHTGQLTDGTANFLTTNTGASAAQGARADTALQAETDPVYLADKGVAGGVATLDGAGVLTGTQVPASLALTGIVRGDTTAAVDVLNSRLVAADGATVAAQWADGTLRNGAGTAFSIGAYSPTNPGHWAGSPPATVAEAIDRLAAAVSGNGVTPVP